MTFCTRASNKACFMATVQLTYEIFPPGVRSRVGVCDSLSRDCWATNLSTCYGEGDPWQGVTNCRSHKETVRILADEN